VWRTSTASAHPTSEKVGYVPLPPVQTPTPPQCITSGLAFDTGGDLFIGATFSASTGQISGWVYRLTPDAASPPTATIFASDVPGANGIAFDKAGNLWVSDGQTGQGRIWKIPPSGGSGSAPGAVQLRVQPLRNSVALVGTNLFPSGAIPTDGVGVRSAASRRAR
jgi:hypothetical protein